ncbi:MAG: hypothetical protein R2932_53835 [Caldilineaceae bacterium]
MAGAERVFATIDEDAELHDAPDALALTAVQGMSNCALASAMMAKARLLKE